jgi:ribosomal protein S18 acetylase RimI-like enzyme
MSNVVIFQPQFRRLRIEDVGRVEEVVQLAYRGGKAKVSWKNEHDIVVGPRVTAGELNRLVQTKDAAVLVAVCTTNEQEQICGCVLVEREQDCVVIGMLAVDPGFQNLGLGKQLVKAAEQFAVAEFKVSRAEMHVAHVRDELLSWYGRLGYEPNGKFKPFPGPEAGVRPLVNDLRFQVIEKDLC